MLPVCVGACVVVGLALYPLSRREPWSGRAGQDRLVLLAMLVDGGCGRSYRLPRLGRIAVRRVSLARRGVTAPRCCGSGRCGSPSRVNSALAALR